jgi:hypothetical protein
MTATTNVCDQMLTALRSSARVSGSVVLPGGAHVDIEGLSRFVSVESDPEIRRTTLILGLGAHNAVDEDIGYVTLPWSALSGVEDCGQQTWRLDYETNEATFTIRVEASTPH